MGNSKTLQPWFSSITSVGLFLISMSPGRDHMTGEARGHLARRHPPAEDGGCSHPDHLQGPDAAPPARAFGGPKSPRSS